jgi:lysophospholipase L1-like esterase
MDRVIRKTKPTLVILLTGVNDLGYSLENTGQRFSHFERFSFKYWAFEHSRLLQLLNVWKQILFNKAIVVDHAASGTYLPQPLGRETPLPLNLRDALPSLAEYDRNIQQIIDIGNALGVRMLFMTQPMLYSEEPYWRDKLGIMYWVHDSGVRYSAATYWKMLALFNGDLITICRNNGVPCYDLAAVVPHSDRYFYDIVHFNDNGARLVAQKTAEFILSNHLLER